MKRTLKLCVPAAVLALVGRPASSARTRAGASALLVALWTYVYVRYRSTARAVTAHERELLRTANWETYSRHYNEQVPTIEEEFDIWGEYHQHRHEMRYDKLAVAADKACPDGGVVLDLGCGSALVADRIATRDATYVAVDYGSHHIAYAKAKHDAEAKALRTVFARCDAERLPFPDAVF